MEDKRNMLAERLEKIIGMLYEEFNASEAARRVTFDTREAEQEIEKMLQISDRITKAAEVLAHIYSAVELDEQVAMLEKAIAEAEAEE